MLNLSLSSYYYKTKEQVAPEIKKENDLLDHIERIALEFPRYGYRRITHQLEREGVTVNHKRVLRLMRESSLLVVAKRKWVKTTDSNHCYPVYSNLVKDFILTGINQIWVVDITYIRILLGFVYLAVILLMPFPEKPWVITYQRDWTLSLHFRHCVWPYNVEFRKEA